MTFSVAVICVSLVVVALIVALIATKRPKNYPPGPVLLPVLGSIYAVPGQGAHFKIEKWRQKYGNIIGHRYGSSYEVYITGVEESIAAMKHPNFQGRKIFNHRNDGQRRGLFFNDGANWAVLKRFTLNYFSEYQKSKIQDLVRDEMTEVLSHNLTDTIAQMDYKFFPIVINILMRIIFGVTKETRNGSFDKIFTYLYKSLHDTRPTGIENYLPLIRKIFFKKDTDIYMVKNVLKKYINEHKSTLILDQPRDFVDAFLIEQKIRENGADENNIFTDEELLSDCLDLVRAGSISTSDTIALVMLYLVLYPEVQRKMIKEIDTNVGCDKMPSLDDRKKLPYCEAVIAECLRINPVVPFTAPHRATEDTEFYGFVIPRDTVVKVSLWTLFRDPKLWNDPDTFEPERFVVNGEFVKYPFHLPFGLGKRSCLMEVMARNIIFLYLTSFFQKFSIHQPPNEPAPSTEAVQGSVTGPKPFKVLIKRRNL